MSEDKNLLITIRPLERRCSLYKPRWCACYDRNALFCQISNMAEDCCDAIVFLRYICSSFSRLSPTFSIRKCYIWKV